MLAFRLVLVCLAVALARQGAEVPPEVACRVHFLLKTQLSSMFHASASCSAWIDAARAHFLSSPFSPPQVVVPELELVAPTKQNFDLNDLSGHGHKNYHEHDIMGDLDDDEV